MFKEGITEEQNIANLRGEFLEDARRRLDIMIENRKTAEREGDSQSAFTTFKAELHTLKGMGQSFGLGSITMISRRLELYLKTRDAECLGADVAIQPYMTALDRIVDTGDEPSDDEIETLLDGLAAPADDAEDR